MQLLEKVPVERILDAFRNDQKVTALGVPWPATLAEKIALLRSAEIGRPVDRILNLAWGLYELDQAEFLSQVRPVWGNSPWTLGDMCAAHGRDVLAADIEHGSATGNFHEGAVPRG